jgi:hypothetical protein
VLNPSVPVVYSLKTQLYQRLLVGPLLNRLLLGPADAARRWWRGVEGRRRGGDGEVLPPRDVACGNNDAAGA